MTYTSEIDAGFGDINLTRCNLPFMQENRSQDTNEFLHVAQIWRQFCSH